MVEFVSYSGKYPYISIGNWSVSDLPTDLKKYKKRDREMYQ